ncbi:MAG: TolB family protein [Chthoniobacterales bacterium]
MKRLHLALFLLALASAEAELPPLIPREILFGNAERSDPQVAPAGDRIAWRAPDQKGVINVWVGSIDGANAKAVTNETHRPIGWYAWAGDSKHILYLQDNGGDEIDHLFSADLTNGNVRDLTPFRGVRAQNVLTDLQHPRFVLVALNLRDRQAFDIYRVDLETGAVTLEATNPGDVLTWATDNDFVIRAATAFEGKSGNSIVRVRDAADKPWRDLVVMPFEQALFSGQVVGGSLVAGFAPDNKSLIIQSALGSDKGRLVRVDLRDGKELEVLAQDAMRCGERRAGRWAERVTGSGDRCDPGGRVRLPFSALGVSRSENQSGFRNHGSRGSGIPGAHQPRTRRPEMDRSLATQRCAGDLLPL